MSARFDHVARLATIPHEPGCYIMKNKEGKIIYIGKAKDLKNRVRNYFQSSGDPRPFVKKLPELLSDIETIITPTEKDALALEVTLIKRHKPRYNIIFKDDKNYPSLRIDTSHAWPRVEIVRRPVNDGARYFGPYDSSYSLRRTLQVLNKHFKLRTCTDSTLENRTRPCLQYQIKRCPGPCVFPIDRDLYMQHVQEAMLFLDGRADELVTSLEDKMLASSEEMEFELAAHYRDQITSIRASLDRHQLMSAVEIDRDAFGLYRQADRILIQLMIVRRGRLEGAQSFSFKDQEFPDDELLSSFLNLYYSSGAFIPEEILLPMALPAGDDAAFEELLSERSDRKVKVLLPQRGDKRTLVETAQTNALHAFEEKHELEERTQDLLTKLQERLSLRNFPERIECFDISNFQGSPIVGSMVVFIDAIPAKKEYRQFKMREVTTQDDFASMHETLTRRLKRIVEHDDPAPDLIIIDGGKGQLGQAVAVLEDLGLADRIDVISLAKSRVDKVGFEDETVTKTPERVFLPGRKNPIVLKQNSAEIYLLQRLRDEAHRCAITFHQKLRRKGSLRSSLDEIPGVGQHTKRLLLKHFGSLKKIKTASLEELKQVKGIGDRTAQTIFDFFKAIDAAAQEAMQEAATEQAP